MRQDARKPEGCAEPFRTPRSAGAGMGSAALGEAVGSRQRRGACADGRGQTSRRILSSAPARAACPGTIGAGERAAHLDPPDPEGRHQHHHGRPAVGMDMPALDGLAQRQAIDFCARPDRRRAARCRRPLGQQLQRLGAVHGPVGGDVVAVQLALEKRQRHPPSSTSRARRTTCGRNADSRRSRRPGFGLARRQAGGVDAVRTVIRRRAGSSPATVTARAGAIVAPTGCSAAMVPTTGCRGPRPVCPAAQHLAGSIGRSIHAAQGHRAPVGADEHRILRGPGFRAARARRAGGIGHT